MTRVAITGIGVVSPCGSGREEFWDAMLAGRSGIGIVSSMDTSSFPAHIGAEIRDFEPSRYIRRQSPASLGRASQLAVSAAWRAVEDSGLEEPQLEGRRTAVTMGTTSGEPLFVEHFNDERRGGRLQ